MKRGLLITFEGIEGCGKSTQCKLAAEWLSRKGVPVYCTREPGGTPIGAEIRRILLSASTTGLVPIAEALLYLADRYQHVGEILNPHLRNGEIVLCDRYHDSTVAYQGYARGIPLDWIESVWRNSGKSLDPDLTLLFDIEPEIGLARSRQKLKQQRIDESRFENETLEFHSRVRGGFLDLARKYPERFVILNGKLSVDEIQTQVTHVLEGAIFG